MPEAPQAVAIPDPPAPPAPPPPSPTISNLDAQQKADDERRQAGRRKGTRQTLIAGESSGALAPAASSGKQTLLG